MKKKLRLIIDCALILTLVSLLYPALEKGGYMWEKSTTNRFHISFSFSPAIKIMPVPVECRDLMYIPEAVPDTEYRGFPFSFVKKTGMNLQECPDIFITPLEFILDTLLYSTIIYVIFLAIDRKKFQ